MPVSGVTVSGGIRCMNKQQATGLAFMRVSEAGARRGPTSVTQLSWSVVVSNRPHRSVPRHGTRTVGGSSHHQS